jgi:hypothetical protein
MFHLFQIILAPNYESEDGLLRKTYIPYSRLVVVIFLSYQSLMKKAVKERLQTSGTSSEVPRLDMEWITFFGMFYAIIDVPPVYICPAGWNLICDLDEETTLQINLLIITIFVILY